jgi:hypothetical protein
MSEEKKTSPPQASLQKDFDGSPAEAELSSTFFSFPLPAEAKTLTAEIHSSESIQTTFPQHSPTTPLDTSPLPDEILKGDSILYYEVTADTTELFNPTPPSVSDLKTEKKTGVGQYTNNTFSRRLYQHHARAQTTTHF